MKKDVDEKMAKITGKKMEATAVPYIVYEQAETRHERREKRTLFWVIIPLIVALISTNAYWLYTFTQYDFVSTETATETITETINQDATDGGNANYLRGNGNITNGETDDNNNNN